MFQVGVSKRLRVYRALTLDPFEPMAIEYGFVKYGALPFSSPYRYAADRVAMEYAATFSPEHLRWDFEELRRDSQYPRIGTPTYLSDGNEYYDDTIEYHKRLESVVSVAGSLERAYYGMVTLLGWSARAISHRQLDEFKASDEIFYPERFTTTPFFDSWLDSTDLRGASLETEFVSRLRQGDVALFYGWEDSEAIVHRTDGWRLYCSGKSSACTERQLLRVLREFPNCNLLSIPDAEATLRHSLTSTS